MKLYRKLRGRMAEYDDRQQDASEAIGISLMALNKKLNGKSEFTLREAYGLLDRYDVPHSEIGEYFPAGGIG